MSGVLVVSAVDLVSIPLWAALSDRVGRHPVYLFGAIGSAAFFGRPFAVDSVSPVWTIVAMVVGTNVFRDAMYGPQTVWFTELFGRCHGRGPLGRVRSAPHRVRNPRFDDVRVEGKLLGFADPVQAGSGARAA